MIIVVEGVHKEELKKHAVNICSTLTDCTLLCGNEKWTYLDWVNEIQNYEHKNVVIVDSWLNSRAKARLNETEPRITNDEALLLNALLGQKCGHVDFVTNSDEETTMKQIVSDYGCTDEYAKKIFNEITYEVLQAKIVCLTNAIKV